MNMSHAAVRSGMILESSVNSVVATYHFFSRCVCFFDHSIFSIFFYSFCLGTVRVFARLSVSMFPLMSSHINMIRVIVGASGTTSRWMVQIAGGREFSV